MKELLIAAVLLVFVLVRIRNLRKCWEFGYYTFPPVKTDKHYTWVYPGYIGGNAKDRRRILRKYRSPVGIPYQARDKKDRATWNHRAVLQNVFGKKREPAPPTFPLRQKMKRAGAHLPNKAELQGLFRRAGRQA